MHFFFFTLPKGMGRMRDPSLEENTRSDPAAETRRTGHNICSGVRNSILGDITPTVTGVQV